MTKPKDIFLVATYFLGPRDGVKTNVAGYLNDDKNINYKESVAIVHGLKDRDIKAAIILNLTQKTVYKNNFGSKNDWEMLAAYYSDAYPKYFKMVDPEPEIIDDN